MLLDQKTQLMLLQDLPLVAVLHRFLTIQRDLPLLQTEGKQQLRARPTDHKMQQAAGQLILLHKEVQRVRQDQLRQLKSHSNEE